MQNYISQRQVEMAAEKPAPAVQEPSPMNGVQNQEETNGEEELDHFKKMNTLQMMDDISRDLAHWQQMIIEQNEK